MLSNKCDLKLAITNFVISSNGNLIAISSSNQVLVYDAYTFVKYQKFTLKIEPGQTINYLIFVMNDQYLFFSDTSRFIYVMPLDKCNDMSHQTFKFDSLQREKLPENAINTTI